MNASTLHLRDLLRSVNPVQFILAFIIRVNSDALASICPTKKYIARGWSDLDAVGGMQGVWDS